MMTGTGSGSGSGSGSGIGKWRADPAAGFDGGQGEPLTTELAKTATVTVNLTSIDGFAGDVTLAATLGDATDALLPGVTSDRPHDRDCGGRRDGICGLYDYGAGERGDGSVLTGTLKVAVASSLGTKDLATAVTVNNVYTVDYPAGTGATANTHPNTGKNITLKRGAILASPTTIRSTTSSTARTATRTKARRSACLACRAAPTISKRSVSHRARRAPSAAIRTAPPRTATTPCSSAVALNVQQDGRLASMRWPAASSFGLMCVAMAACWSNKKAQPTSIENTAAGAHGMAAA